MELCAFSAISKPLVFHTSLAGKQQLGSNSNHVFLLNKKPPLSSRRFHRFAVSASDDSIGTGPYFTEERDSVITLEEAPSAQNKVFNEISTSEVPKEEEPVEGGQQQTLELLDGLKLESGDAYSIALYGTGALAGLWLVSAIVAAIDSIPVFPKLMEVVGFGYTLWFTTRFLIFKESREELAAKIEEVKKQVVGSD